MERHVGAPRVLLSAMVSVLGSALLCILVQTVVPPGHGPEFALFPYMGELVAIGLIGGVVPLLASFAMLAASARVHADGEHPLPFRSLAYWLAVLLVALFITLFFTASQALYGGLGIPKLWAFWLVFAGSVAGVDYWWLRGRRLGLAGGTAECYVMGTLGVFASDLIRTLTGLASAPGGATVWGGGGLLDVLFWFGLYSSLSFLGLRILLVRPAKPTTASAFATIRCILNSLLEEVPMTVRLVPAAAEQRYRPVARFSREFLQRPLLSL